MSEHNLRKVFDQNIRMRRALERIIEGQPDLESPEDQCRFDEATARAALFEPPVEEIDLMEFERLHRNASPGPWADRPEEASKTENREKVEDDWHYEDGLGHWMTSIRPEGGSVEDTIAEVWGGNHNECDNAALIVFLRNNAEKLIALLRKDNG